MRSGMLSPRLCQERNLHRSYYSQIQRLAYLAPDITTAILDGRQPPGLAATGCWMWCAHGPTRARSTPCCSTPPRRTANGFVSGLARTRGQAGKSQALHLVRALSAFTVTSAPETGDKLTGFGPFSSQCRAVVHRQFRQHGNQPAGHRDSRNSEQHAQWPASGGQRGGRPNPYATAPGPY